MVDIVFDQLLSNSDYYEHRCLENTKKLYKTAGKCDYEQQNKVMIEVEMVSTPEGCTNNSPMTPIPSASTKISVKENHSVNLQRHWMSNIRSLFGCLVQLRRSARQLRKLMSCGHTLKSAMVIQK